MHRLLYRMGHTLDQAREGIAELATSVPESATDVALLNEFLAQSRRGIVR